MITRSTAVKAALAVTYQSEPPYNTVEEPNIILSRSRITNVLTYTVITITSVKCRVSTSRGGVLLKKGYRERLLGPLFLENVQQEWVW